MTAADRDAAFREVVAVFCEHGFRPEPERCPAGCAVATHDRFGEAVTSAPNVADVAAVLAEHRVDMEAGDYGEILWSGCTCGDEHSYAEHDAHVAAALLASEPIAQALAAVEALARVEALAETWERSGFATGRLHADDIRAALRPEGGKS